MECQVSWELMMVTSSGASIQGLCWFLLGKRRGGRDASCFKRKQKECRWYGTEGIPTCHHQIREVPLVLPVASVSKASLTQEDKQLPYYKCCLRGEFMQVSCLSLSFLHFVLDVWNSFKVRSLLCQVKKSSNGKYLWEGVEDRALSWESGDRTLASALQIISSVNSGRSLNLSVAWSPHL